MIALRMGGRTDAYTLRFDDEILRLVMMLSGWGLYGVAFSCVLFAFVARAGAMGSVTSSMFLHILLAQPHAVTGAIGLVGH